MNMLRRPCEEFFSFNCFNPKLMYRQSKQLKFATLCLLIHFVCKFFIWWADSKLYTLINFACCCNYNGVTM